MFREIILLLYACSSVCDTLQCYDCLVGGVKCNDTSCHIDGCDRINTCDGNCMLLVTLTSPISSTSLCYSQNASALEKKYLGTSCTQIDSGMNDEKENVTSMYCLCQQDYCNSVIFRLLPKVNTTEEPKDNRDGEHNQLPYIMIVVAVLLLVVTVLLTIYAVYRRKLRMKNDKHLLEKSRQERFSSDSCSLIEGGWDESGKHSCSTYKYSTSLGSHYSRGSKGNALNQNDQHLPIELEKIIGRGRYADVWKAKLLQEKESVKHISVKVFRLPNYGAWRQEKEILSEKWMKHENIIEYYASEQHSTRGLQYWLITDYYSKGNLQDFLINNTLTWNDFCDMVASTAKGLAYLHSEQDDAGHPKLPVAHRDIKSCNILVKDDGVSCVLADFGLSLKLDPTLTKEELANAGQVGTSRYMAPELLERLVNLSDIEMFKRVDMYAFALVMWELATRCEVFPGMVQPYQPPYGDLIPDHPTKEQILLHVCRSKQRPEIRREWDNHSGLAKYVTTMTECWDTEPEARLTASCVYQRIQELRNEETVLQLPLSPKEEEALEKENLVHNDITQLTELISTVV